MPTSNDSKSLPITLFVESVNLTPEMDFTARRITTIDLELNMIDAKKVADELKKRLKRRNAGTVRIRFTGRLVL